MQNLPGRNRRNCSRTWSGDTLLFLSTLLLPRCWTSELEELELGELELEPPPPRWPPPLVEMDLQQLDAISIAVGAGL